MIKIIKHGNKKETKVIYIVTCPVCGCEFECETEDFFALERTPNGKKFIHCPDCDVDIEINSETKKREEEVETNYDTLYKQPSTPLWTPFKTNEDPCETCPNKGGPKDVFGNPVAGDSMCEWCPHYKYRVTCSNITNSVNCSNTPAYYSTTPAKNGGTENG